MDNVMWMPKEEHKENNGNNSIQKIHIQQKNGSRECIWFNKWMDGSIYFWNVFLFHIFLHTHTHTKKQNSKYRIIRTNNLIYLIFSISILYFSKSSSSCRWRCIDDCSVFSPLTLCWLPFHFYVLTLSIQLFWNINGHCWKWY